MLFFKRESNHVHILTFDHCQNYIKNTDATGLIISYFNWFISTCKYCKSGKIYNVTFLIYQSRFVNFKWSKHKVGD